MAGPLIVHEPVTLEHVQEVLRRVSNTDVTISALHARNHLD